MVGRGLHPFCWHAGPCPRGWYPAGEGHSRHRGLNFRSKDGICVGYSYKQGISPIPVVSISYVVGKGIAGKAVGKPHNIKTGAENPKGRDSW